MGYWFIIGTLAAFGAVCVLWALAGWIMSDKQSGTVVIRCRPGNPELGCVRRFVCLRELGLIRCTILLVDCGLTEQDRKELAPMEQYVEICSRETLLDRLETERIHLD